MTFYGVIDEIWELDYYNFRIPIFKCIWVDNNNGIKVDDLGFTLHVSKNVKEQIWKAVTLTFNVCPTWKKSCLSSAGSKWRTLKTTLTKEYVYKMIDTPYLNIPPDGSGIDLNVWKDFLISRLSDKFKQMSDEHKELAKLNKWPHNLSRKGYARYASENQSLLSGDNDLDRATFWLEARKKKDGEFENDELKEIASKIVGFIEKKKQ
ncbi:hypothetical protein ACS0TY_002649 [Phlomoides rotata]